MESHRVLCLDQFFSPMLPLGNIIRQHGINFQCYADDTQLYLSMKPDETFRLVRLQACLKDIKTWMTQNCLPFNSDKTEVVIFGPERFREELSCYIVTLDGISLASSTTVRNLGVIFDQNLSFDAHIKLVLGQPSFTFVILLKSGTSCLRVMQKN